MIKKEYPCSDNPNEKIVVFEPEQVEYIMDFTEPDEYLNKEHNCYSCAMFNGGCGVNRALKYDFTPCDIWEQEQ